MAGKLNIFKLGQGGVQLTKDPLHLADDELAQSQNAELDFDQGRGALSKRNGLTPLTTALSGSVYGMVGLPLLTTYTRYLYLTLGTFDSDTWLYTTDGTNFTSTSTPSRAVINGTNYQGIGTGDYKADRRIINFRTFLIYPATYTSLLATPASNTSIPVTIWDGTSSATLFNIPIGQSSSDGNLPFTITDMLVANGLIYFSVHDPTNAGNMKGRVMQFDLSSGIVSQVATTFGFGTGAPTTGVPSCLAWYQGKLWVGLDNGNGTANVGNVVWAYPGLSTTWTVDTATLPGYPHSMATYRGDLYVGISGTATTQAAVYTRAASTGAWTSSDTQVTSGTHYYGGLIVYSDELYATVYSDGGADFEYIRKYNGASWSTDRDITANDSAGVATPLGNPILFGSDLFMAFQSTTSATADGFLMRKRSGTWSKVVTDNFTGKCGVLVSRT